jgi:hypothetical protein
LNIFLVNLSALFIVSVIWHPQFQEFVENNRKSTYNLCKKSGNASGMEIFEFFLWSASKQLLSVGGAGGAFIKNKNLQHYAFLVTAKHRIHCWYTRYKSSMRHQINLFPMLSLLDVKIKWEMSEAECILRK